jgi:hypothetical protein
MVVSLTERGADAATRIRQAVTSVEAWLEETVGHQAVADARMALVALATMGLEHG